MPSSSHSQGGVPCRGVPCRGVPCQGGYPGGGGTLPGGTLPGGTLLGGYPAGGYPAGGIPCWGGTLPGGYPAGGYPARGVPSWGEGGTGYPARGGLTSVVSKLQLSSSAVSWPYIALCPMELWVMLQSIMEKKKIMGWVPPPPVDRQIDGQTRVKTSPSHCTTYGGGKKVLSVESDAVVHMEM